MSCANAEKFCNACFIYSRAKSEPDYDLAVHKLLKKTAKASVRVSMDPPGTGQNFSRQDYEARESFLQTCCECNYEGALMAHEIENYFGGK